MRKISELAIMPKPAVYRRSGDGLTYIRLNEAFHVRADLHDDGKVIGAGSAEQLDPNELVEVLWEPEPKS